MAWPDDPATPPVVERSKRYSKGDLVRAPRHTGWYYKAETDGETGAQYPVDPFPRASDVTLIDGTVTWLPVGPKSLAS